jgi:electron transfer flavoprotein alpha subunit
VTSLVIIPVGDADIKASVGPTIAAASLLESPVDVLVVGEGAAGLAATIGEIAGVRTVLTCDAPIVTGTRAEAVAALAQSVAGDYEHFVAASSTAGKNIMPRVAALLDIAQVSDITRVVDRETFEHPIYAGNAVETVRSLEPRLALTVRTSAFAGTAERQAAAPVRALAPPAEGRWATIAGTSTVRGDRPELISASVIVSGGRGLGSKEKFEELLLPLADKLGAALGASRAAVDSGYAPNDWQVGQTGKIVAPDIYIAVGISGAIQHLAGMKEAKTVIAINKDESAPINEFADHILIGDLFAIVPELTSKL